MADSDIVVKYKKKKSSVRLEFGGRGLITCKICLMELPPALQYQLASCQCVFCLHCIKEYLKTVINDGHVLMIECPDGQCQNKGTIEPIEIQRLVSEETFDKYEKLKFEIGVDMNPNLTWCPEPGCDTVCHICQGDPDSERPIHCPKCHLVFCSTCKGRWHGPMSCEEYARTAITPDVQRLSIDKLPLKIRGSLASADGPHIKRCPVCSVPIERNAGCAQMMCQRCRHVFCWYCLLSLDDDFLLRHYDKGPCKDRLGHSRASVIWHRAQVVGIFAGFGVLLLVASPFLLLAAPCILCCKCCKCWCCVKSAPDTQLPTSIL